MEQKVTNLAERIVALETKAVQAAEDRDEMKAMLHEIKEKLDRWDSKLTRWEGKLGGVLFAIGCLWIFFSGAAKALLDWLTLSGKG